VAKLINSGLRRSIPRGALLVCMVLLAPPTGLGETPVPVPAAAGAQEKTCAKRIMERLRDSDGTYVLVCAHRADWRHFPENSLAAIEGAIKMGVDIVEIDVRKTSDGHLVLMHDKSVNRTTTGQGRVCDLALADIRKLYLKDAEGRVTTCPVPTLEEAMLAAKGRVVVNLDKGFGIFADIHDVLRRTDTLGQVILGAPMGLRQMSTAIGPGLDDVVAMPFLNVAQKDIQDHLPKPSDARKPAILQFDFNNADAPILKECRAMRKNGSRVWANAMDEQKCAGHGDIGAVKDADASYGWLLNLGFNVIQTDQPELLIRYLKGKGLHE